MIFCQQRPSGAAVLALDSFRLWNRSAQAYREVIGEMIAADGNGARVADYSAAINYEFSGPAADIEQTAAQVALFLRQARLGGGERLKHRVANQNSCAICGGDKILRRCNRGS